MYGNKPVVLFLSLLIGGLQAHAQTASFSSPNGVREECRILPRIPGGQYSKGDAKKEQEYCALDFYDTTKIALCPKTWSTSPGTIVDDISASNMSQQQYEAQPSCGGSKSDTSLVKFKQTMNQAGTSGTFSPSSLLYYHLSRYFDATVDIPVAVYRSMDKDAHFARVSRKAFTGHMGKSSMNRAGWQWLYKAEQNPASYSPTRELFIPDNKQIYGVLVGGGGVRYGAEVNGIRSKWGDAQNNDFQNTPAFLALRSQQPLKQAIQEGLQLGKKNSLVAKAMGGGASDFQMAVWMKELTEITILDYIFSQQDRIGNIDYKWIVYAVDHNGTVGSQEVASKVARSAMNRIPLPAVDGTPNLIQKTQLSDNDAGGRNYVNYTKRTQMLQKIRHIHLNTYRQLIALNHDLQSHGELFHYVQANFNLDNRQLSQMLTFTNEAAGILQATCKAGRLRFDLYSPEELLKGSTQEVTADCERP